MKKFLLSISLLFLTLAFIGCSLLAGVEDSKELKEKKTFMTAQKEVAQALEKYNDYYARADAATQEEWKKTIDPVFIEINAALKAWKVVLGSGGDISSEEEQFLQMKTRLFALLLDVFSKKKEG